ncbi:conserved hypothetical protein [Gluconacetobacter diazotrophicus PA1 5]|uniref:Uncharacterized protein n=2 Tax=Gluconacetobacter diazotrophicus TaxID=33996 RepID=A9HKD1_GLUDA|nr:hypothetical protein [Gluconacetobacter diazotrophicus]ACI50099.1 conserved hypothetical protein [Gluconacetobacter diazotrophicus PA1 5]MBB2156207.1 hypothetical protein [Gluconacetobacter diazotrophicus]TWB07821.1 hypothetical protein FBZ86_10911 [Gluconacetobacter diazotrophicus]CAP56025.1 hypothetical protein GDI2082 [Gluconacetobacter diazotrophicus PA1 5]
MTRIATTQSDLTYLGPFGTDSDASSTQSSAASAEGGAAPVSSDGDSVTLSQEALSRLDQIIQSSRQSVRADAEQRVDRLQAQIRQLMFMKAFLSPKALAQELAQFAHQLAAAVQQYAQNQGTSAGMAEVGDMVISVPQDTQDSSGTVRDGGDVSDPSLSQPATDSTSGQAAGGSGKNGAGTSDSPDFQQTVRKVAAQLEDMLKEAKNRLKKQHNSDIQSAQDALDEVEQDLPKLS